MASITRRQIFVRPRGEIMTVLDWQQVSNGTNDQFTNETCLDAEFFEREDRQSKIGYVCGSYELTLDRMEDSDRENEIPEFVETEIPGNAHAYEEKRSVLNLSLEPNETKEMLRIAGAPPTVANVTGKKKSNSPRENVPESSRIKKRSKGALDTSLAKLRHEMNSLRRQDMALMEQLLTLNNKIQDFKLSQCAVLLDGSSDESDDPETLMEKPLTPKRWHSQGSLRFDRSGQTEEVMEKPLKPKRRSSRGNVGQNYVFSESNDQTKELSLKPKRWRSQGSLLSDHPKQDMVKWRWSSRGSLGSDDSDLSEMSMEQPLCSRRGLGGFSRDSDGSDYHSASNRSSMTTGSNPSLSGSDVASSDSGHESSINLKSGLRQKKAKLGSGDPRRVSFGNVWEYSESDVILPAQPARRYSDFRVAEVKPIMTLSKRQSTIW